MRRFSIPNPFASGYVSEVPDYAVPLDGASFAQDIFVPSGMVRQRRGWVYSQKYTSLTDFGTIRGVAHTKFAFTGGSMRTATSYEDSTDDPHVLIFTDDVPATSPLKSVYSIPYATGSRNSRVYLPRCVYQGELIFCHQSGERPLIRYSGSNGGVIAPSSAGAVSMGIGSLTLTIGTTPPSGSLKGQYIWFEPPDGGGGKAKQPPLSDRIVLGGSSPTVENMRNSVGASSSTSVYWHVSDVGTTWPAVPVYEGVASAISGNTVTLGSINPSSTVFIGTPFAIPSSASSPSSDAIAVFGTGSTPHEIAGIESSNSTQVTTNWNISSGLATNRYMILRRCPFKDAAVHRESLWGTGVSQYPSTVYVWPPSANIGIPPQSTSPYAVTSHAGYANASVTGFLTDNDYTLFSLDVPSKYDASPIVALLSTDGPLLVLKTDSVYAIHGTFDATQAASGGNLDVNKVADWGGCIDLRSAISGESGVFWAGADGIYTWRSGQIVDITAGKIQREWRALMNGYSANTSTVACGIAANAYLIVSVNGLSTSLTSGAIIGPDTSAPSSRTLVYDLRSEKWLGRMSNFSPEQMWTVTGEDGDSECLSGYLTTKFIDVTPAFSPDSTSATDENSSGPAMKLWSTCSLAQAEGTEGESRFCDLSIHTNIYDSSSPYSSVGLTAVSGGSLYSDANTSKSLDAISGDSTDRVDRNKRSVNRTGRLHQLRVESSSTSSSNKKIEVSELVLSFRDSRRGT
jgi:hypothetical protein